MMRFKVDENLPVEIADVLRDEGYEADTVVGEGLAGQPDEVVFAHAQLERRILVTMDKGFGDIRRYTPHTHAGIVLLRSPAQDKRTLLQLFERVLPKLLERFVEGDLWIVEQGQVRVRSNR
ncbi:MAG: DUF5615 family PIN-like protein [Fimbriimonadales bacterium]|nr:DUF5615 family PIN-like protein [Fimbriimonadales bacterium]